jgi:tripartite-type tricarboxylate transporter receptor subunit TctC
MLQPLFVTRLCLLVVLGWPLFHAALAQSPVYPHKPISIVVGYPPGGSTDLTGRAVAAELSKRLNVPVVIENLGGAGGAIGAQKVAASAPDGYTLLVGSNNEIAIRGLVSHTVKYRLKDFTPIGLIASQPMVLVAPPHSRVKTVTQLISLAQANPEKLSFGSSGVGTALHLAGEMIKNQYGLRMTHVPYRGVAPLVNDLLGDNIDLGVFVLSSALPYIRSGQLTALGTTEIARSSVSPEVPALAENPRLTGFDINVWFALMGPAKLPVQVVEKLKNAMAESLQSPELRTKLQTSGSTIAPLNVDMPRFLREETLKYQKIVDFAQIKE